MTQFVKRILNNFSFKTLLKRISILGSNDVFRLSDEEFWEAHGGMGRLSPGTLAGMGPEISPNSTQIDLLTANEETQVSYKEMKRFACYKYFCSSTLITWELKVPCEEVEHIPHRTFAKVSPRKQSTLSHQIGLKKFNLKYFFFLNGFYASKSNI